VSVKKFFAFFTKRRILLLAVVAITGLIIWRYFQRNGDNYNQYQVEVRDITETIELSGEVDAKLREDLHFLAGGLVTYYPWQEGDEITKFSTIASLDQRTLKKTLQKYLNLYSIQRGTFEQTIDDNDNSVPDGELGRELKRLLEANQYTLDNSVLDVELQDLAIRLSRLYAPFTGILVSSPITTPHVNVLATDVFTLVDPSTLYFVADLDESDLGSVEPGIPVEIELDAFDDSLFDSQVESVSFGSKETTTGTTYEVVIPLPEEAMDRLRLGLNGTAHLIISKKEGILTLPIEAIVDEGKRIYVYLMEGGKMVEHEVETGISDNNYVEITSGLSEGDTVVIENK
jgi:RND family efflux transporter MFP subunit